MYARFLYQNTKEYGWRMHNRIMHLKIWKNHQGEKKFGLRQGTEGVSSWVSTWADFIICRDVDCASVRIYVFVHRSICFYTPTCKSAQAYAGRCHRTMEKPSLAYNNISLLYLIPDIPVTKISYILRQFFTYYHNIFANR